MTTIATSPLSETLQSLVDARLDTIDRMLLGRVNRHDRLAIVREVESQIFDLLQGRDPGPLDRDDVLAVLARLDPPEAYLPEDIDRRGPTGPDLDGPAGLDPLGRPIRADRPGRWGPRDHLDAASSSPPDRHRDPGSRHYSARSAWL